MKKKRLITALLTLIIMLIMSTSNVFAETINSGSVTNNVSENNSETPEINVIFLDDLTDVDLSGFEWHAIKIPSSNSLKRSMDTIYVMASWINHNTLYPKFP